jgi:spoIIIJ-associated protein
MADETTIEVSGETVGEAKWSAFRELERRFPGLDRQAVEFQVLAEGERGLMGIGREPARVLATLTVVPSADDQARARAAATTDAPARPAPSPRREPPAKRPTGPEADSPAAEETRRLLRAVAAGLQLDTDVHVAETPDGLLATLTGEDLGVVIGKHGHTIDALQYLVNATLVRQHPGTSVIVDAHGYRKRRESVLRETATRAARDALRSGRPVALEPMSSIERKFVHLCLKEREDVETASEGRDPHRHIVVRPRS